MANQTNHVAKQGIRSPTRFKKQDKGSPFVSRFRKKGGKMTSIASDDTLGDALGDFITIHRPIYSQVYFDEVHPTSEEPAVSCGEKAKAGCTKCCTPHRLSRAFIGFFPFFRVLRNYNLKDWLIADLVAGLTVGILNIPQGMAYGLLASLPPIYGMYVSFFPVILYIFLGTSNHISIGIFAVTSLMVGAVVDAHVKPDPVVNGTMFGEEFDFTLSSEALLERKLKVAMALTFIVGAMQFLMGVLRLGLVTRFLSPPLISGFTTGASFYVFTSQVKHIFGLVKLKRYTGPLALFYTYIDFFKSIGDINWAPVVISAICIVILMLVKELVNPKVRAKIKIPVPIDLFVVILATIVSHFVNLKEKFNVAIVEEIPTGLPEPALPDYSIMPSLIADAVPLAIVAFAISVSVAKIMAKKHGYEIDPNQELIAYGASNLFGCHFSAYVAAASLARSAVQDAVGGKTQITSIPSMVIVLSVILFAGPLFKSLPMCVLASIIMVALKGLLMQFKELPRLWPMSKVDFSVWFVSWFAVVLLNVTLGLAVAVGYALMTLVFRSQWPDVHEVALLPGTDLYVDSKKYPAGKTLLGVKVIRFGGALNFANREYFRNMICKVTGVNPVSIKKKSGKKSKKLNIQRQPDYNVWSSVASLALSQVATSIHSSNDLLSTCADDIVTIHTIVLDCAAISYIDTAGVNTITQVVTEFNDIDVDVMLAACHDNMREMLAIAGYKATHTMNNIFVTVHDAVMAIAGDEFLLDIEEVDETEGEDNDGYTTTDEVKEPVAEEDTCSHL